MKQKATTLKSTTNGRNTTAAHSASTSTLPHINGDHSINDRHVVSGKSKTAKSSTLGEIHTAPVAAGGPNGHLNGNGHADHLEKGMSRKLLNTLVAVRKGDFSARFIVDETLAVTDSLTYRIAQELNEIIEMNQSLVRELERTSSIVGKEGKITQRAALP